MHLLKVIEPKSISTFMKEKNACPKLKESFVEK